MRCRNGNVNSGRAARASDWPGNPRTCRRAQFHMRPSAPVTLPPNKTRIVATIGPASNSPDVLERMIRAGMNVARLNFSHGEFPYHQRLIQSIRAAAKNVGQPVAIMADLPGPKIRIGKLAPEKVEVIAGDKFTLTT